MGEQAVIRENGRQRDLIGGIQVTGKRRGADRSRVSCLHAAVIWRAETRK